jgi:tetratricopeptide (TPR) repeat protein
MNEKLGDTQWAVESQVSLEKNIQDLQLLSKRDLAYTFPVHNPMYIEYGWDFKNLDGEDESISLAGTDQIVNEPRFFTISEEQLIDYLNQYKIDYLILSELSFSNTRFFENIPDYFNDSPAFEHLFVSQWNEGADRYAIHIYKVNRDRLSVIDYPTIIATNTWTSLEKRAKALLGNQYDVFKLNQALGGGPIVLSSSSETNFPIYKKIGDAYLEHNEYELAALEYHMALKMTSPVTKDFQNFISDLSTQHPDYSATWLLTGDIYSLQGENSFAESAYKRALATPNRAPIIDALTYRALAELYFSMGQDANAIENFQLAAKSHVFGDSSSRNNNLVAQANLLRDEGKLNEAIQKYIKAYNITPTRNRGDVTVYDFVQRFADAQITSTDSQAVAPTIFVINQIPYTVLYAHPTTEMKYRLTVPPKSVLTFSPALAPAVWKPAHGDGVGFTIYIQSDSENKLVFYQYRDPKNILRDRRLDTYELDLSAWSGKNIVITFKTDPGPNQHIKYDWAGWVEPKIVQRSIYNLMDIPLENIVSKGDIQIEYREMIAVRLFSNIQFLK